MRLSEYTTLRLGGTAEKVYQPQTELELVAKVAELDRAGEAFFVLGGGSNVVVADAPYRGTVIWFGPDVGSEFHVLDATTDSGGDSRADLRADSGAERHVFLDVGAAVVWDRLVAYAVARGLSGLECLSGIPGLVGATPMQNVGAYGQEVKDSIVSVRAYDRHLGAVVTLPRERCAFAYRSSCFRGSQRWILLSVRLRLAPSPLSLPVTYGELAKALGISVGGRAPLLRVRETVIALRRSKGMVLDPSDSESVSAGSFFTNPLLTPAELTALLERCEQLGLGVPTQFPVSRAAGSAGAEKVKLAAAWLIERAGFPKGYTLGRARISRKHALALVNDAGTTAELVALARAIRSGVLETFGVSLDAEPVFVGERL
jgi:UDP-N-acetylmuramate dehydrogenase